MTYKFHDVSVLVIEDNQPMSDIIKALLKTFGVGDIYTAKDGQSGFETFCKCNADIIIADWLMSPLDGISFTEIVRNDPMSPNPFVPVILVTGFSEKHRVLQARDAGVTEFLVKPFNARELYRRFVQLIERPRQFVKSEDFFGPDRRRKNMGAFRGPFRRESDYADDQILRIMKEEQLEAQMQLQTIRAQAGLKKGDRFDLKPENVDMVNRHNNQTKNK